MSICATRTAATDFSRTLWKTTQWKVMFSAKSRHIHSENRFNGTRATFPKCGSSNCVFPVFASVRHYVSGQHARKSSPKLCIMVWTCDPVNIAVSVGRHNVLKFVLWSTKTVGQNGLSRLLALGPTMLEQIAVLYGTFASCANLAMLYLQKRTRKLTHGLILKSSGTYHK
jgi:hypothetical protein